MIKPDSTYHLKSLCMTIREPSLLLAQQAPLNGSTEDELERRIALPLDLDSRTLLNTVKKKSRSRSIVAAIEAI